MSFRRGEPGTFTDRTAVHSPESEFTPYEKKSALPVIGKAKRGVTGSRVRFWPDRQIFIKDAELDYEAIAGRARQTSFLVPGPAARHPRRAPASRARPAPTARSRRSSSTTAASPTSSSSSRPTPPVTDVWRLEGSGTFTETVPVLDVNGHMTPTELERECVVDIALRWGQGYDTRMQSFVNIITTPKGGTHVAGFEQAIVKVFRRQLELNARRLKVGGDKPEKDDVLAGMTAVVTVRLAEPQFEGQTKEVLGTNAVRAIVAKVVEQELTARLTSPKRGDKAQAALLLEKVVSEMKSRISARLHKETQRRKNALESSTLPAKLRDCRTTDVERSELFIVEGDSAMGTAKEARSSEFQALLPIRGKILNVQKASVSDMLKNAECASIIQVIGAGSGRSFDLEAARYGKVIIMTDADVDGAHIRTLLLTLFFRYMRPLVEAGRVYAAMPPLHRIEVINAGVEEERAHLHLQRARDAPHADPAREVGQEGQAADAALQGPRRDGRRPARRHDDGPAPPHAAPGDDARPRGRRAHLRAAHGQRGRPAQGLHHRVRGRGRPGAHRRLTRRLTVLRRAAVTDRQRAPVLTMCPAGGTRAGRAGTDPSERDAGVGGRQQPCLP